MFIDFIVRGFVSQIRSLFQLELVRAHHSERHLRRTLAQPADAGTASKRPAIIAASSVTAGQYGRSRRSRQRDAGGLQPDDGGQGMVPASQSKHQATDFLRMPDELDQVHAARSIRADQPILDCPLLRTGPLHDRLDALMRAAELGSQSIADDRRIAIWTTAKLSTSGKTPALLRQHFSALPRLQWTNRRLKPSCAAPLSRRRGRRSGSR